MIRNLKGLSRYVLFCLLTMSINTGIFVSLNESWARRASNMTCNWIGKLVFIDMRYSNHGRNFSCMTVTLQNKFIIRDTNIKNLNNR